jgi:nucleotide-binding universal stress UspA family protein
MSEQIIVGYDGTKQSSEAVRWAADEALARHASMRLVSCYDVGSLGLMVPAWPATEAVSALVETTEARLETVTELLVTTHPQLKISTEVCAGPASTVLLRDLEPDDLVVVGASSHAGGAAFWLGSTPRHLVRHSPCPVAVVRGPASRGRPDRVVVGVDGSPSSERALRWAADEADRHGVALVVVHTWWYPYLETQAGSAQARDLTEVDAECVLERAVAQARDRCGVNVSGQLVERSTVPGILETVRDGDVLVLGSRGRGAVASGLFGSTVNSVLDRCAVPVVVVPDAQPADRR